MRRGARNSAAGREIFAGVGDADAVFIGQLEGGRLRQGL